MKTYSIIYLLVILGIGLFQVSAQDFIGDVYSSDDTIADFVDFIDDSHFISDDGSDDDGSDDDSSDDSLDDSSDDSSDDVDDDPFEVEAIHADGADGTPGTGPLVKCTLKYK